MKFTTKKLLMLLLLLLQGLIDLDEEDEDSS